MQRKKVYKVTPTKATQMIKTRHLFDISVSKITVSEFFFPRKPSTSWWRGNELAHDRWVLKWIRTSLVSRRSLFPRFRDFSFHIKLIFTRKVVHLASFWKWGFLELGSGLLRPFTQLQSKHSQFWEYFILNNKKRFDKKLEIFRYFFFTFYIQFILLAGK